MLSHFGEARERALFLLVLLQILPLFVPMVFAGLSQYGDRREGESRKKARGRRTPFPHPQPA